MLIAGKGKKSFFTFSLLFLRTYLNKGKTYKKSRRYFISQLKERKSRIKIQFSPFSKVFRQFFSPSITMGPELLNSKVQSEKIVAGSGKLIKFLCGKSRMQNEFFLAHSLSCLLYTSPSPRDRTRSRMPSSA